MARTSAPSKPASDKRFRPGGTLGKQNQSAAGRARYKDGGRGAPTGRSARGAAKAAALEKAAEQARRKELNAEWTGIATEDEGEEQVDEGAENDDSAASEDEDFVPPQASSAAGALGKKPGRKAGGTGKKGKVFVEEKNDLLSLVASITGATEAKNKAKLNKAKTKPAKPAPPPPNQPSDARKKQLDAARAVVAARSKANKDKKKAASAPKPAAPASSDGAKKRVSFA
ncbi:hypothetical protein JCM10213_002406 [Rhodosporidiobolus nylandii]